MQTDRIEKKSSLIAGPMGIVIEKKTSGNNGQGVLGERMNGFVECQPSPGNGERRLGPQRYRRLPRLLGRARRDVDIVGEVEGLAGRVGEQAATAWSCHDGGW